MYIQFILVQINLSPVPHPQSLPYEILFLSSKIILSYDSPSFYPTPKMSRNNKTWLFYTSAKNATAVLPLCSKAFRDLQSILILSNFITDHTAAGAWFTSFWFYITSRFTLCVPLTLHVQILKLVTYHTSSKIKFTKITSPTPSPKLSKIATQFPKLPKMSSTSSSTKPLYHKHK